MPSGEQEPLLGTSNQDEGGSSARETLGSFLESPTFHKFVITLIAIDAVCVLADLSYSLLHPDCACAPYPASSSSFLSTAGSVDLEKVLEILSHISLAITTLFLIEIPLHIFAFGFNYYNPFPGGVPHASFHLFDLIVIVVTFVLEVVLRGGERELAGLLIVFRLWRLVKLVGGIAVGTNELGEEDTQELMKELEDTKKNLSETLEENQRLRARLTGLGQDDVLA
ncbi:hypothetical protein VKT23_001595 [Stygiomarasmius scandens]|uniref:Voltage-gated hydrogen channel 1 n=1 Tax=Marasmiellus scandens TaxID=2682957 RepID=A0ABR1K0Q5_9AGAR